MIYLLYTSAITSFLSLVLTIIFQIFNLGFANEKTFSDISGLYTRIIVILVFSIIGIITLKKRGK